MSATTILLIRHGVCDAVHQRLNGRMDGVKLTAEGRAQAQRLVHELAPFPLKAIYSSPLERTQETAQPLSLARNLPIQVFSEFNEVNFGEWTGRNFEDLKSIPQWIHYNTYRSSTRIPGGETFLEVQNRIHQGFEKIKKLHAGETVAIFTHGDIIRAALVHTLGMSLDHLLRFEISPASISTLQLWDWGPQLLGTNFTGRLPLPA